MAAQQIAIAETIRSMKIALRRERAASPAPSLDSSEDDSDGLHTHTNRGNKLRNSAQYVSEGRLDTTGGQGRYKRKVQHAGYERYIIKKKARLYDDDGDVVDPLDIPSDVDEDDLPLYGQPVEEDPFGQVRLEDLLRPLTSAAELAVHPSLSKAYTSQALTQMARDAAEMVRRERAGLWKAKRLLERLRGDGEWVQTDKFITEQDHVLLNGEDTTAGSIVPSVIGTEGAPDGVQEPTEQNHADVMDGVEVQDHVEAAAKLDQDVESKPQPNGEAQDTNATQANGEDTSSAVPDVEPTLAINPTIGALATKNQDEDSASNSGNSNPSAPSHRMTTRARARSPQLPASPSPSPSDSASMPTVAPWFLFPATNALPDRDLGLPIHEAEETRKLLLLYVQKQENIVRQLEQLFSGLQRTDRLRQDIYRAAKAEAHMVSDGKGGVVTEMSDGEDWYDPKDWGLPDVTLEKGKDEVDEGAEEEGRRVGGRRRRVVGR
jgi:hypothetical protein